MIKETHESITNLVENMFEQRISAKEYVDLCQKLEKLPPPKDEDHRKILEKLMEQYNLSIKTWDKWDKNDVQIEDSEDGS